MVVQSNSGIDSLIRCSAIKLISKIQSFQEIELYSLILQCMAVYRECFVIDNTRQTLSQREEQQVIMLFSSELEICYKAKDKPMLWYWTPIPNFENLRTFRTTDYYSQLREFENFQNHSVSADIRVYTCPIQIPEITRI